MPKKMEEALKKEAAKKGFTGERANKYIYGTMRKTGWKPGQEEKKGSWKDDLKTEMHRPGKK